MILHIRHSTSYRFTHPARYSVQYLRLTPRPDPNQVIRRWRLYAPGRSTEQADAFGNRLHVLVIDGVHEGIEVTVEGEVETEDTSGVLPAGTDPVPLPCYLRPTALTADEPAVRDFAEPFRRAAEADRLEALHRLSRAVAEAVRYETGGTTVTSTAARVLELGHGVCQDQAHVFAAAARVLGIPTRYVSGYVHVQGDGEEFTATHAWSESWVDDLGWVAFDVTNEICANDAHVRLAVGPDYLGCAPIRGMRRGGGEEDMEVHVRVTAMGQQ